MSSLSTLTGRQDDDLESAVAQAIQRAHDMVAGVTFGVWSVRIIASDMSREVMLPTQSQLGQLAFDLQCLGFSVDIEPEPGVDLLCVHRDVPMQG